MNPKNGILTTKGFHAIEELGNFQCFIDQKMKPLWKWAKKPINNCQISKFKKNALAWTILCFMVSIYEVLLELFKNKMYQSSLATLYHVEIMYHLYYNSELGLISRRDRSGKIQVQNWDTRTGFYLLMHQKCTVTF